VKCCRLLERYTGRFTHTALLTEPEPKEDSNPWQESIVPVEKGREEGRKDYKNEGLKLRKDLSLAFTSLYRRFRMVCVNKDELSRSSVRVTPPNYRYKLRINWPQVY
jgi:hypothetical protein